MRAPEGPKERVDASLKDVGDFPRRLQVFAAFALFENDLGECLWQRLSYYGVGLALAHKH